MLLTFNDTEEKAVEKAMAALADMIPLESMQLPQVHLHKNRFRYGYKFAFRE